MEAAGAVRIIFAGGQIDVKFEVILGLPVPKLGSPVYDVMVIPFEVTVDGLAQVAEEVIMTVMLEPLASNVVVYVDAVCPAMLAPFLCHW